MAFRGIGRTGTTKPRLLVTPRSVVVPRLAVRSRPVAKLSPVAAPPALPVFETCDAAVRRVLGVDPAQWTGTFYVHCSGKTGELVMLSGCAPGLRRRLPKARIAIVTMEHYRYALKHLRFPFDEHVVLPLISPHGLAKSVEIHNGDFRGFERYQNGLIVNCYRGHAWHLYNRQWPKGSFYHSFAEGIGLPREEYSTPGWGDDLEDRWGPVAVAFASLNVHSARRRQLMLTPSEWNRLAATLRAQGLRCVATGHVEDPRPTLPGWEWINGDLSTALTLVREARFVVGGNSGMVFLAGMLSRGPVVMLDEGWQGPLLDVATMTDAIPASKILQFRLDGTDKRDRMAFGVTMERAATARIGVAANATYAQSGEDRAALQHFNGRVARFLDLGAHDGSDLSNTRLFAESGWGGTLVEPAPTAFDVLQHRYGRDSRFTLVHAAVGSSAGLVGFHERGVLSTSDEKLRRYWDSQEANLVGMREKWKSRYFTAQITVDQLLARAPGPYHFVSIDTEGVSVDNLKALPLAQLQTEVICVEIESRRKDIVEFAAANGFANVREIGCNLLLTKTVLRA